MLGVVLLTKTSGSPHLHLTMSEGGEGNITIDENNKKALLSDIV
jgi:hypothetical protein